MVLPVGILAVLAAVGGLLNIPGVWHPFGHWIGATAESLTEPSTGQEYLTSLVAVVLGLAGVWLAHRAFRAGRELVPAGVVHTTLSHKLYFDEVYAALFERPAQAAALNLRERFEQPLVHGSLDEVGRSAQQASVFAGRAQTGLLRTYAVTIATAVVVLAIVFLVVR